MPIEMGPDGGGGNHWVAKSVFDEVLRDRNQQVIYRDTLLKQVDALRAEKNEANKESETLRDLLCGRDREIATLKAENDALKRQIATFKPRNAPEPTENEPIKSILARLALIEASCAAFGDQLHELEGRLCFPSDRLNAVYARINRLEAALRPIGSTP